MTRLTLHIGINPADRDRAASVAGATTLLCQHLAGHDSWYEWGEPLRPETPLHVTVDYEIDDTRPAWLRLDDAARYNRELRTLHRAGLLQPLTGGHCDTYAVVTATADYSDEWLIYRGVNLPDGQTLLVTEHTRTR